MLPKITRGIKALYGFGQLGGSITNMVIQTWAIYFLAPPEDKGIVLVPASVMGAIFLFGRIVDAIADPLVSNWTDNSSSPKGRRIPFLRWSAIPMVLVMILYFTGYIYTDYLVLNIILAAVLLGFFYFLFTVYLVPYLALIPELSRDAGDRLDLSTSGAVFNLFGTAIAMVGAGLLIEYFTPEESMGQLHRPAFLGMIIVMGVLSVLGFYVTAYTINEKKYCLSKPSGVSMIEALKLVSKNRAYMIYLGGNIAFNFGFITINVSVPYYTTVLMNREEGDTAILLGLTLGVSLISFALINWGARKLGNRIIMVISTLIFILVFTGIYFVDTPPFGLDPFVFGAIMFAIAGIPVAALFIILNAIVAEVSELKISGKKPGEAIYFGMQGLTMKAAIGLATVLATIMFDVFGKTQAEPLGVKLTGIVGAVFSFISLIFFYFYPEKQVRAELKEQQKHTEEQYI